MKKQICIAALIAALVFTACEGPAGADGTPGTQGPAGFPGTTTIPSTCPLLSGSSSFPGYTVWKHNSGNFWYKFSDDGKTVLYSSNTTDGSDGIWDTSYVFTCIERTDIDLGVGGGGSTWVITASSQSLMWQVNGTSAVRYSANNYTKQ
jgi:hypothetical protein